MTSVCVLLRGGCHCGDLEYQLEWPENPVLMPARRCGCSFCTRFNGTWTSHPSASLVIRESRENPAIRYRFGTATADFLICSRCGIAIAATCDAGKGLQAVVNVNTLAEEQAIRFDASDSNFDGEAVQDRLQRRTANWIGQVQIQQT